MRRKSIDENPFEEVKKPKATNSERQTYISTETIAKVIEACPDAEWRLLACMARFAGLRTPSEPFSLRIADIDWARNQIRITCAKTETHWKTERSIAIFPEIRGPLMDVVETLSKGAEYVFHTLRQRTSTNHRGFWQSANLRPNFLRILRRTGWQAGPGCSTTCEVPPRLIWRTGSRLTLPASGWAIRAISPSNTTRRLPLNTWQLQPVATTAWKKRCANRIEQRQL